MKNLKIAIATLTLVTSALFMGSCRKTDYMPNNQTYSQNVSGGLQFKVITPGDAPIPNVGIGISNTSSQSDHDIFMTKRVTNASGIADFDQLSPGTYYYKAEWSADHVHTDTRQGFVQVSGNQTSKVLITFSHDQLSDSK